jgi:hypothetical protein
MRLALRSGLLAALLAAGPLPAQPNLGRITPMGVVRAQAVVDSVFLERKLSSGWIEAGDWASYLMGRLGVTPLPDSTGIIVVVDSQAITFRGRIQDIPPEGRSMLGALEALVDSTTSLEAQVVTLPASDGLIHSYLRGVSIGGFPVPDILLRSMLMTVGEQYPALTKTGRDLFVQIPTDGAVIQSMGGVRLTAPPRSSGGGKP